MFQVNHLVTATFLKFSTFYYSYHSIVLFGPSSSGVFALKPNSFSAIEVSSLFLGRLSGIEISLILP